MSQEGATSIQDLQNQPPANGGGNQENGSRAVVQEILQEIESNDQRNAQQNNAQQQYNLDQSVQQQSFAPPNQEEARRMQQEMMMQQQQQQMMQQQMHAAEQENQTEMGGQLTTPQPKTLTEKLVSQIKSPVIVAAIFLLLSVAPTKQLLQKIPKALSETGDITFVGSAVTAILAGVLFFVLNMATKNM